MEKKKYNFKTPPYDHQRKALELGWNKESFAYFMEMGTGKTKVLIDNLGVLFSQNLINAGLIIAPKSVYTIWQNDELPKHLNVEYESLLWKPTLKEKLIKEFIGKETNKLKLLIMNVEAFSTKKGLTFAEEFIKIHHCLVSIDESTAIKNHKAIRTKNILKLRKVAKYRRILTGSPITKNPLDLYTQCYFLDPNHLGFKSLYAFKNYHCHFEIMHFGDREIATPVGFKNLEEIENKLPNFSFRVTKEECLDLPPKIRLKREIELTREQKLMYHTLRKRAILELEQEKLVTAPLIITRLLRLQQILCGFVKYDDGTEEIIKGANPRLDELLDVLEETQGGVIIWATYRRTIQLIYDTLAKKYGASNVATYYGETESEMRQEIVTKFQKGEIKYFIGQPRTGGYGLTLTNAKTVIYFNNTYDMEVRLQSEDRAHRIGQKDKVTYIDIVCPKTIDEKIMETLNNKKKLADEITGDNWKELFSL